MCNYHCNVAKENQRGELEQNIGTSSRRTLFLGQISINIARYIFLIELH